jgi:hypothetical protein
MIKSLQDIGTNSMRPRTKCCSPALLHPYVYMLPSCNSEEFNAMQEAGIVDPMDGL